jgi:hypothetical protein
MIPGGENGFYFLVGDWRVAHRRLKERLAGCDVWEEFPGTCSAWKILGGRGNVDDNLLHLPAGTYRAATLRSFDPSTGRWAIWWLDARHPLQLDTPVMGSFENGTGAFFADDTFNGRPIRVRFLWTRTDTASPRWTQAFSPDDGRTWEDNWVMDWTRA